MIKIQFDKENLIKSPLNYVGGKYKLLPQILPLFPEKISTFVDLFCGGCNVGINIKANKIICNDIESHVIDFLNSCNKYDSTYMVEKIENLINTYGLSKTNQDGYLRLRNYYNSLENKTWDIFYTLVCYSFNNQIRFNSGGNFNMPFGKNRSSFNSALKEKFIKFVNHHKGKNIKYTNIDFTLLKPEKLLNDDYVYCDPPYLITIASYNEQDGWNETKEKQLLSLLDSLNERNIKFGLSNVLESKGVRNEILISWSKKYNVHILNYNYKNCNYQKKDNGKVTEVLITNY